VVPDQTKYDLLISVLRRHGKIAIAFSGGVDSTLLLHAALEALGAEKVIALYARSTLNSAASVATSRMVFERNFPQGSVMREIEVLPLSWPEFAQNDKDRCCYCKKRIYTALQKTMMAAGCTMLADGTNSDDRNAGRPGLRAISELQVMTPLADVGLTKVEVRQLAQKFGLSNFDLPSNSCLATRIPENQPITETTLRLIELAEDFLHSHGFSGCRVRVEHSYTIVEVQEKDIAAFIHPTNRTRLELYFHSLQLAQVVLSLQGR
jgi:pyridinium-3,5-biscarboxylic acid mononucleotide sulfurtransferase